MGGFNRFFSVVISKDSFSRLLDQCYLILLSNTYEQIPSVQFPLKQELDKISVTPGQCLASCITQHYDFRFSLERPRNELVYGHIF